jgi:hypothetical protein
MAVAVRLPISTRLRQRTINHNLRTGTSVAEIPTRRKTSLIADWLRRTKSTHEPNHLQRSHKQAPDICRSWLTIEWNVRTSPRSRLRTVTPPRHPPPSNTANSDGIRGHTSGMLIHESHILQVTVFGTVHANLTQLDFSLLLPHVMIIGDEVDAQLT